LPVLMVASLTAQVAAAIRSQVHGYVRFVPQCLDNKPREPRVVSLKIDVEHKGCRIEDRVLCDIGDLSFNPHAVAVALCRDLATCSEVVVMASHQMRQQLSDMRLRLWDQQQADSMNAPQAQAHSMNALQTKYNQVRFMSTGGSPVHALEAVSTWTPKIGGQVWMSVPVALPSASRYGLSEQLERQVQHTHTMQDQERKQYTDNAAAAASAAAAATMAGEFAGFSADAPWVHAAERTGGAAEADGAPPKKKRKAKPWPNSSVFDPFSTGGTASDGGGRGRTGGKAPRPKNEAYPMNVSYPKNESYAHTTESYRQTTESYARPNKGGNTEDMSAAALSEQPASSHATGSTTLLVQPAHGSSATSMHLYLHDANSPVPPSHAAGGAVDGRCGYSHIQGVPSWQGGAMHQIPHALAMHHIPANNTHLHLPMPLGQGNGGEEASNGRRAGGGRDSSARGGASDDLRGGASDSRCRWQAGADVATDSPRTGGRVDGREMMAHPRDGYAQPVPHHTHPHPHSHVHTLPSQGGCGFELPPVMSVMPHINSHALPPIRPGVGGGGGTLAGRNGLAPPLHANLVRVPPPHHTPR